MPKLNIDGTRVNISDDFLKMSPQQQDDFVKNTIMPSPEFQAAKQKAAQPAPPAEPQPQGGFLSEMGKAVNPLEIAKEVGRTASENLAGVEGAFGRGDVGDTSPYNPFQGMGKTMGAVSGLAQLPLSLPIGAARNIIGHGMTGLEHLAGTYINPEAARKDDLQKMYEASRGDVDTALMAARPAGAPVRLPGLPPRIDVYRGGEIPPTRKAYEYLPPPEPPPPEPTPPPPPPTPGEETRLAAQRQNIALPRALTSDSPVIQQAGQIMSKQPLVGGGQIGRAIEQVPAQLGEARTAIAEQFGGTRTPGNVAHDIRQHVGGAAEAETGAAELAARQADEAARAAWQRSNQAREQAIGGYEAQSAREAGAQVGDVPPTDMGGTIVDTVRANHEVARNTKDALYRDAGSREGTVFDEAVGNADRHVNMDLRSDRGGHGIVTTTPTLTPAAMEMRQSLRNFSERGRQRGLAAQQEAIDGGGTAADAAQTGINLRTLETQRQELGNMAQGAANDADRRAARRIMGAFDDWHEAAIENHFDGDPGALDAYRNARAANRDFRERFGYNEGNDADKTINKMVRGEPGEHIGPNEVANTLTAQPDKAGRLLDRIYQATGDHPNHGNVVQAVRGGFWNKLSSATEGTTPRTPEKIASDIYKFTRGPNRDVAARIYSPQDQALMQRHADVLRAGVRARESTAQLAKANEPVPTEVTKGPMQELADRVLGRGQKSDEAIYNTIEGYAKSKSAKDLNTLAGLMRNLPDDLRGNFLNSFIRGLGKGQKDAFSPAIFEKEWRNLTPQTKTVLTGNSGHVAALDDIAAISKRFDEVHRRFGNPSGSGQSINFGQLASLVGAGLTGTLANPLLTFATYGGGGYALSRFLAKPQGAASLAKFAHRVQRLQETPTIANAAATRLAARNMRNTALSLGIATHIPDQPQR